MKVIKAVITAAGRGTRFLPAVKSYSKELIPVLAKPNIQYLIEELVNAGITQIAIVHRSDDTSIKRYFSPDLALDSYLQSIGKTQYLSELKALISRLEKFEFIPQDPNLPYGSASPALAAKEFIGSDPFVYFFGDDLVIEPQAGTLVSQMIKTFENNNPFAVVASQEVPWSEISRYGSVDFSQNSTIPNQITGVLEKMSPDQAPSNKAVFGRFVASAQIITDLEKQSLSPDNELWWAEALNKRAKTDIVLNQTLQQGEWMTTGDPLRWLKANIKVALQDPTFQSDLLEFIKSKI